MSDIDVSEVEAAVEADVLELGFYPEDSLDEDLLAVENEIDRKEKQVKKIKKERKNMKEFIVDGSAKDGGIVYEAWTTDDERDAANSYSTHGREKRAKKKAENPRAEFYGLLNDSDLTSDDNQRKPKPRKKLRCVSGKLFREATNKKRSKSMLNYADEARKRRAKNH